MAGSAKTAVMAISTVTGANPSPALVMTLWKVDGSNAGCMTDELPIARP
jgi:hypothetical protein